MDWQPDPGLFIWYERTLLRSHHSLTTSIGGVPPYIYGSIGGADRWIWFVRRHSDRASTGTLTDNPTLQVLANLLSLAGVCPFVGSLSDLIGRRYVAILGASLICIGMIICSTANSMNHFIGRQFLIDLRCYNH